MQLVVDINCVRDNKTLPSAYHLHLKLEAKAVSVFVLIPSATTYHHQPTLTFRSFL